MGIKSDALKVLAGIDRLSEAYSKAKGSPMMTCTLSKAQKSALEAAVKAEKISVPSLNMARMSYGGIELKVQ